MKLSAIFHVTALIAFGSLAAAELGVVFEDSFDKKLGDGWKWLREHKEDWRIKDGALEIQVQPGKAATVKNALLRKAPDRTAGKYAVEVTISFTQNPTNQYEQAGITWYHNEKPVFKLVHEHVDGKVLIVPGFKSAPNKTVQLRLVVDGRQWTAQYRQDLKGKFLTAATGQLPPPGNDEISLQCYDGPSNSTHWIRFDDFRIVNISAAVDQ